LPVSVFLMSVGQVVLLGAFVFEGNALLKLKRFGQNKAAVIAASLILLHFLGLLYSSDFAFGWHDIRVKAPLLLLPLFIAGSEPLSEKFFHWLMALFVGAVTVGTLISMGVYEGFIPTRHGVRDIRDISIFISHIRFSMMIAFSVFLTVYFFYQAFPAWVKTVWMLLGLWLMVFLFILNSLTGIVLFLCVLVCLSFYGLFSRRSRLFRIAVSGGLAVLTAGGCLYAKSLLDTDTLVRMPVPVGEKTALGNSYRNDSLGSMRENGNLIWMYVCEKELEPAWNTRSLMPYAGKNKKGDDLRFTLIRYLSSKGLAKDAAAVQSLSDAEVKLIESGIANVRYAGRSALSVRIMETIWEFRSYRQGHDPNGHSVTMRIEFWRAALGIIRSHLIAGVGTGDVQSAFTKQYDEMKSPLDKDHRWRSHNQFLSIAVAFGITGLLWFLLALFYPPLSVFRRFDYFYFVFFVIVFLSFFTEDTLETQAGVTFFAFFNAVFLFGRTVSARLPAQV